MAMRYATAVFPQITKALCSVLTLTNLTQLAQWQAEVAVHGRPIAFVPTMGNLHSGHGYLVAQAQAITPKPLVLVSIFVNPLQFNDAADLARYPRTLDDDLARLREAGIDAVFVPPVDVLLPEGCDNGVRINPGALAEGWEGAARPGHFAGMATIVAKLFHLIRPQFALFGEKDFQQLAIVQGMVRDLNFPVTILAVPTQRAPDGLALSSRNRFLNEAERATAPKLYAQLVQAAGALTAHESVESVLQKARAELTAAGFIVDYFALCDATSLQPLSQLSANSVLLAAAQLGAVRLIDNLRISP
jgi:pantoate--beta-alanine ligase